MYTPIRVQRAREIFEYMCIARGLPKVMPAAAQHQHCELKRSGPRAPQGNRQKYSNEIREISNHIQIIFCDFSLFYQIWINRLDWNRVCARDRIIEKSNSSIC